MIVWQCHRNFSQQNTDQSLITIDWRGQIWLAGSFSDSYLG
jgi:hypothetical protein